MLANWLLVEIDWSERILGVRVEVLVGDLVERSDLLHRERVHFFELELANFRCELVSTWLCHWQGFEHLGLRWFGGRFLNASGFLVYIEELEEVCPVDALVRLYGEHGADNHFSLLRDSV